MARVTRGSGIAGGGSYLNVTGTTAATTVKTGSGYLRKVILNTPVATSVITLWDSLTASGIKIGTITVPASMMPDELVFDVAFSIGLTITVATAASDITVVFE